MVLLAWDRTIMTLEANVVAPMKRMATKKLAVAMAMNVRRIFAIAWGFIFTFVFYRSGSLFPGIIAHGLVDAFSKFSIDSGSHVVTIMTWVYIAATILTAIGYGLYLAKMPDVKSKEI